MDDAHGVSWSGRHGRGTVLGNGAAPPRTVMVASLAKAFAAGGAVMVMPDAETARFDPDLRQHADLLGPAAAGAAGRGHRVGARPPVARDPRTPAPSWWTDPRFNALAEARGLPLGSRDVTPIRFVRTGDSDTTFRMAADLMRDGFYINTAVFPAVTQGQGGLRIALTVHQTLDDIRDLVDAIARRMQLGHPPLRRHRPARPFRLAATRVMFAISALVPAGIPRCTTGGSAWHGDRQAAEGRRRHQE